jgi:membrane protease YdiL (CAAX protease family)
MAEAGIWLAPPTRAMRGLALVDVAAVGGFCFALLPLLRLLDLGVAASSMIGMAGAVSLATLLLRHRGSSWHALGFRRPKSVGQAVLWTVLLYGAAMALVPALVIPLARAFDAPPQDLSAFAGLPGNTVQYLLLLLPVSWGSAAFGEELIYRGFIQQRLGDGLGATRLARAAAVIGQALIFALAHAYLGPRGMMNAGALGFLAGAVSLANGRNLWPLIIAHGLVDTTGISALFFGFGNAE